VANGQRTGAVALQALQGGEGAVVGALRVCLEAQMDPKPGFFFVELGFRYSELGTAVVATYVAPEFAVDTPGGFQVPEGVDEFLNEDALMRVPRLVSLHQFRMQAVVFFLEIGFGGHNVFLPHSYHAAQRKSVGFSWNSLYIQRYRLKKFRVTGIRARWQKAPQSGVESEGNG
jgi:hypothetical protein